MLQKVQSDHNSEDYQIKILTNKKGRDTLHVKKLTKIYDGKPL